MPNNQFYGPRRLGIIDRLRNTTNTYKSIAEEFNVSQNRVYTIAKILRDGGIELPNRQGNKGRRHDLLHN